MTMEPAQSWDRIRFPGGIPLLLQRIPQSPPEGFRMGSRGNYSDEEPVHRVVIPSDSYLGTFVVTEQLYAAVAHDVPALRVRIDPSNFKGDTFFDSDHSDAGRWNGLSSVSRRFWTRTICPMPSNRRGCSESRREGLK